MSQGHTLPRWSADPEEELTGFREGNNGGGIVKAAVANMKRSRGGEGTV